MQSKISIYSSRRMHIGWLAAVDSHCLQRRRWEEIPPAALLFITRLRPSHHLTSCLNSWIQPANRFANTLDACLGLRRTRQQAVVRLNNHRRLMTKEGFL